MPDTTTESRRPGPRRRLDGAVRRTIVIELPMWERLAAAADAEGITISALIRRAVDRELSREVIDP